MAISSLSGLMKAAKVAEELSASRRKRIDIQLTSNGATVLGYVLNEHGAPLGELSFKISWQQIVDMPFEPEDAVREIDRRLVAQWRERAA